MMNGWRKELVEKVVAELKTGIPELNSVDVFNQDIAERIAKGKIERAPFAAVQYVGFASKALGESAEREIVIAILFGVNGLRGEQSAFKGDDAPSGTVTMDTILEKFEGHFWGLNVGTNFPAIVGDEEFVGMSNNILIFANQLIIKGIFCNK